MVNALGFSKAEESIRKNPRKADAQAFEWERFLKTNLESSPEILSIKTEEEFRRWVSDHPEKHVDPSVWEGKEISDYYYRLRGQNKNEPEGEKIESLKEVNEKYREGFEAKYTHTNQQQEKEREKTSTTVEILTSQENPFHIMGAPAPTESQAQQPSSPGRPPGGGINRGINTINNFARRGLTNPFGKIGQRVVGQTALRGISAFLASQVGLPILITLAFIVIFTIITVGFGGAPPSETGIESVSAPQVPSILPTETIMLTPVP